MSNFSNGGFDLKMARSMARRVIEHHFNSKPRRVVNVPSGLSNFVFLVDHSEGDFVVRISPEPARINAYIKEQWVINQARKAGVPSPEILEVGNEVVPHPYMVSRRVEGKEATYHPDRLGILREMGRYAALINTIETTGFGRTFDWSNNQLSRNETWGEFLNSELNLSARLDLLEKHGMLTPSQTKKIRSVLQSAGKGKPKPSLNHGDIRLKNVMVNEKGEIAALLDWETSLSSLAPHWELSLALHDLSIDEKQVFLEGYGLREETLLEISPVLKAINLINYAPTIELLANANDLRRLEQYRTRLSGTLDLYSL